MMQTHSLRRLWVATVGAAPTGAPSAASTHSLRCLWVATVLSVGCSGTSGESSSGNTTESGSAGFTSTGTPSSTTLGSTQSSGPASGGEGTTGDLASSSDNTAGRSDSASSSDSTAGRSDSASSSDSTAGHGDSSSEPAESSSTGDFVEVPEDEAFFVPQGVSNTLRENDIGEVWLTLFASTLVEGPDGLEYYTAIRNDGEMPVCQGSVTTYFMDKTDTFMASWGASLYLRNYYRHENGEGDMTLCIGPGDIAMSATPRDLPPAIVLDELWYMKHEFPGFLFYDIVPIEQPVTVTDVEAVPSGDGNGGFYRGTFTNRIDETLNSASVAIFPVNRVGRPLGIATSRAMDLEIPPGGTWTFETTTVRDLGDDFVTFP